MKKSGPEKQGLYDPCFEHESCGIGFVVDTHGPHGAPASPLPISPEGPLTRRCSAPAPAATTASAVLRADQRGRS